MKYYVLQVQTRGEATALKLARRSMEANGLSGSEYGTLLWPRRKLMIRRKGKVFPSLAPIFPGYLFLEADGLQPDVYWAIKRVSKIYKFLKDNRHIEPLSGYDRELLVHFLHFGEIVEQSKVYYDENKRIRVLDGPMKGLEGQIVKVDRRKKRAKVRLELYKDSYLVDFGFEVMEPAEGLHG